MSVWVLKTLRVGQLGHSDLVPGGHGYLAVFLAIGARFYEGTILHGLHFVKRLDARLD